jgi:hypothetical protein
VTRFLALVLAALLVAGCDVVGSPKLTPQPKTLSYFQLVSAANRACARANRRAPELRKGLSYGTVKRKLGVLVGVQERLLFVLRGLSPPPANKVAFQRLLASFDRVDLSATQFIDAFDAGQIRQLRTLAKRIASRDRQLHLRALRLGLRSCARV